MLTVLYYMEDPIVNTLHGSCSVFFYS